MNISPIILVSLISSLLLAQTALAVPPPDFLFNLGASLFQAFSLIIIFFSAVLVSVKQYARVYISHLKHKKALFAGIAVVMVSISAAGAYFYGNYQQKAEYENWIAESEQYNQETSAIDTSIDKLKFNEEEQPSSPIENQPVENEYITFIRNYYNNIATGKLEAAYAVSKKSVPINTYKDWYKNVTNVTLDNIQEIDKNNYSLQLTLTETGEITSYATLMTLEEGKEGIYITDSTVRVLSTKPAPSTSTNSQSKSEAQSPAQTTSVNTTPQSTSDSPSRPPGPSDSTSPAPAVLAVSNGEFDRIIRGNSDVYVLDAREDEEYEIGRFPGSTHIRFADLLAGQWISVPDDRPVYVLCWSGIRGKEVAEFLKGKKIDAHYVESGANGWVSYGGKWDGYIKFVDAHPEKRFQKLVSLDEVKNSGATIVDSRTSQKFNSWHIPGSVNIPVIYTPSARLEETLNQVPAGSSVITVCDDFISCFDAKITGLKLERRGNTFLGRYNKPWEYRSSQ